MTEARAAYNPTGQSEDEHRAHLLGQAQAANLGFHTYSIEALQIEHARCLRKAHAVPELEMREAWLCRAAVVEQMLGEREAVVV